MGGDRLLEAIAARDVRAALHLIHEDSASLATATKGKRGPLMAAIHQRLPDVTTALLEAGLVPTVFEAAALGDLDRIRRFTAEDPGLLTATDTDGWTALHLAAHFGQARATATLLDRGADPQTRSGSPEANTPLHAAAAGASAAAAELILEEGASVDAQDAGGNTPLHVAAAVGATAVVAVLLEHGASATAENEAGATPLDIARARGHEAVVEVLAAHGA